MKTRHRDFELKDFVTRLLRPHYNSVNSLAGTTNKQRQRQPCYLSVHPARRNSSVSRWLFTPRACPATTTITSAPVLSSPIDNSLRDKSASPPILPNPADPNFVVAAVQKVGPAVVRINAARTVSDEGPYGF
jgi:hypothetical protein